MVPLGSVATFRDITGPYRVARYNLYPAAEVQGATAPGFSTGQALAAMERLAAEILPARLRLRVDRARLQERLAGNTGALHLRRLACVFVFLLLAAQYESWTLPLAVILIVPMCLLAARQRPVLRGMDNNILGADRLRRAGRPRRQERDPDRRVRARRARSAGIDRFDAAVEAARHAAAADPDDVASPSSSAWCRW